MLSNLDGQIFPSMNSSLWFFWVTTWGQHRRHLLESYDYSHKLCYNIITIASKKKKLIINPELSTNYYQQTTKIQYQKRQHDLIGEAHAVCRINWADCRQSFNWQEQKKRKKLKLKKWNWWQRTNRYICDWTKIYSKASFSNFHEVPLR